MNGLVDSVMTSVSDIPSSSLERAVSRRYLGGKNEEYSPDVLESFVEATKPTEDLSRRY